ncbi:MAG: hypothetical protein HGJ93_02905 [Desulfosarcina sp.]|nr:hypothetical protein [Desulfosarcina sp.]MBC2764922.1 hypothetical protein [Desulfosarcina sp.]
MNFHEKKKLVLQQLEESRCLLDRALETLRYSFSKCNSIKEKAVYCLKDQESFEALTSRFARASDILTQKVLKTLFTLIQENPKTFLDAANLLEKIEIIENADDILNIRELRNQIAHEYVIDDLQALFSDVLRFVPELERVASNVNEYIEKNIDK